jgi:putative transposase
MPWYTELMPRKPRISEIGGIYHVLNRGVEKRKIFLKNQDYSRFIFGLEFFNNEATTNLWNLLSRGGTVPPRILGKRIATERDRKQKPLVELLAFTLMPNHYHLVLREIQEGGISLFMRKMGGYSTYFNKQYKRVGSLLQSRYTSVPIQNDVQLSNVFVYVHTNPVELIEPEWKEFKVKDPKNALAYLENYRWSSYHDYVGNPTFPLTTQRTFFLDFYGKEQNCRRAVKDWVEFKAQSTELGPEILD